VPPGSADCSSGVSSTGSAMCPRALMARSSISENDLPSTGSKRPRDRRRVRGGARGWEEVVTETPVAVTLECVTGPWLGDRLEVVAKSA
jgi:hypothetical protein